MNGEEQTVLVAWEALAFVFALLPGIIGLAYCYECGRKRESPTWSGYWELLRAVNKTKSEAYHETASLFSSPHFPKWSVKTLAWLFMLIVSLVSPGPIVTLSGIALCIPGSGVAYWLGRKQPEFTEE